MTSQSIRTTDRVTDQPTTDAIRVGVGDSVEMLYDDGELLEVTVDRVCDLSHGIISLDSPLGLALMGAREGECRFITVGSQTLSFQVLRIR